MVYTPDQFQIISFIAAVLAIGISLMIYHRQSQEEKGRTTMLQKIMAYTDAVRDLEKAHVMDAITAILDELSESERHLTLIQKEVDALPSLERENTSQVLEPYADRIVTSTMYIRSRLERVRLKIPVELGNDINRVAVYLGDFGPDSFTRYWDLGGADAWYDSLDQIIPFITSLKEALLKFASTP